MTDLSSVKRSPGIAARVAAGVILLLPLLAAPLPVAAQQTFAQPGNDGGPLQLIRPADPAPPAEPHPQPRTVVDGVTVIDDLGAVTADAAGVLDAGRGGLPVEMWAGSSRAVVLRALDGVPVAAPSPARQDLLRRLLLSVAAPPSGPQPSGQPSMVEARAGLLVRLGATEDARRLIAAVPAAQRTEALDRAHLDSLLIDNRLDDACALAGDGLARWDAVEWQKAQVFCALRADQPQIAALNLTMLREQGEDDPLFLWAAEHLSGLTMPLPATLGTPQGTLTPLSVAMLRATGRTWPPALLAHPEPWVLRAQALTEGDSVEALSAAERAALHGALSPAELIGLYRARTFREADFARSLGDLTANPTPETAALLFQLAERQEVPAATAEVIARALELATRQGLEPVASAIYAPLIERQAPGRDLFWFAGPAGRALYMAGRFDSAAEWFRAAAGAAAVDAEARRAADLLWPLSRLAVEGVSDRWPAARLEAWRDAMAAKAAAEAGNTDPEHTLARREARLLTLLQATGDQVRVEDWMPLWATNGSSLGNSGGGDGFVPAAPVWNAVAVAAADFRLGESVLLALMVMDRAAPADLSDAALARGVETLRVIGLDSEARRIAVEAAAASGL